MGLHYALVEAGTAQGLSHQTLNVVVDEAQRSIELQDSWDAATMSACIAIYEVLNMRLLVRSMVNVWQPRVKLHCKTPQDLDSQLTAEDLSSNFLPCSINTRLDQVARILLIVLSALMQVHTQLGLLIQL